MPEVTPTKTTVTYDPGAPAPVEAKVQAGAAGAGLGVGVTELVLWILDQYVLSPGVTGDLPTPITIAAPILVGAALAWVASFYARHTARPDLPGAQR